MKYQSNLVLEKKWVKSLFFVLFIVLIVSLGACDKDKEDEPDNPTTYFPELTLQSPDTTEFVIGVGESFEISVTAIINPLSTTSLSTLQVLHNFNNSGFEMVLDSVISDFGKLFVLNDYTCYASDNVGSEEWKIIVTDDAGGSDFILLNTEVVSLNPSLNFISGEYEPNKKRIDGDTTLAVGQEFVFGVNAMSGSLDSLRRILIVRNYENASYITIFDSILNSASFDSDIVTVSYPNQGNEEFKVTVWDKADRQSSISFTITTIPPPSNITTYEDIILGAQNSTTGIAFATIYGTVYSLADAKENAADIDFLYFYGATNLATLAAPDDATAAQVFNNAQNGLQSWDVLNETRFKLTEYTSSQFNSITSATQLIAVATMPNFPDQSKINNLSTGDVLAFETAGQKYGLIRIDNIMGQADGNIEITVKIQ